MCEVPTSSQQKVPLLGSLTIQFIIRIPPLPPPPPPPPSHQRSKKNLKLVVSVTYFAYAKSTISVMAVNIPRSKFASLNKKQK